MQSEMVSMKGSALVITLMTMILMTSILLVTLSVYEKVERDYITELKKIMVFNVTRSTLETVYEYLKANPDKLQSYLGEFQAELKEFPGTVKLVLSKVRRRVQANLHLRIGWVHRHSSDRFQKKKRSFFLRSGRSWKSESF